MAQNNRPIEVLAARTQHGWDPRDDLISDERLTEIIGLSYRCVADAMRAARARADRRGYATVRYLDRRTSEVWERGDEPALPGRAPLCRRVR